MNEARVGRGQEVFGVEFGVSLGVFVSVLDCAGMALLLTVHC